MAKNSCFPLYDGARCFELGCHIQMQTPRSKLPLHSLVAAEQGRCRTTLESFEIDDAVHHLPSCALRGATATCQCLVQELLTRRLAPCCRHLEVRFLFDEALQSTIHTRSSLSACACSNVHQLSEAPKVHAGGLILAARGQVETMRNASCEMLQHEAFLKRT